MDSAKLTVTRRMETRHVAHPWLVIRHSDMLSDRERALRIVRTIEAALSQPPACGDYVVTRLAACGSCPPFVCPECGCPLPGDSIVIDHFQKGRRRLNDKAIHYLGHGVTSYQTGYIHQGKPVVVNLDLDTLEAYLSLS